MTDFGSPFGVRRFIAALKYRRRDGLASAALIRPSRPLFVKQRPSKLDLRHRVPRVVLQPVFTLSSCGKSP